MKERVTLLKCNLGALQYRRNALLNSMLAQPVSFLLARLKLSALPQRMSNIAHH